MLRKLIASVLIFSMIIPQNVYALVPEAVSQTEILQDEQIEQGEQGEQGEQVEQREPDEQGEQVESLTPDSEENPGKEDDRMVPVEEAVEELTGEEELIESSADGMPEETEANETDINEGDGEYTFSGGSGTEAQPYLISTVSDLENMHNYVPNRAVYFKLNNDISYNNDYDNPTRIWVPYKGNRSYVYFDGNNHTISNLYIKGTEAIAENKVLGLTFIQNAREIKNLTISNVKILCPVLNIDSSDKAKIYMSSIAGNVSDMDNCKLVGKASFVNEYSGRGLSVGGLAYSAENITNSHVNADIIASDVIFYGGDYSNLAGVVFDASSIDGCSFSGSINAKISSVEGIVGSCSSEIRNCTTEEETTIYNTYTAGEVYGIAGNVSCQMSNCINNSQLSAALTAAGLVRNLYCGSDMSSCINNGEILEAGNKAGIAAHINANTNTVAMENWPIVMTDCKNTADIDGAGTTVCGIALDITGYNGQGEISLNNVINEGDLNGSKVSGITNMISKVPVILDGCSNIGNITGNKVSGLVYSVEKNGSKTSNDFIAQLINSGNIGVLKGNASASGIVSEAVNCSISNCYNNGDIFATQSAAGIILLSSPDETEGKSVVSKCVNSGNIQANTVGGIAGTLNYGVIEKCYNSGDLLGKRNGLAAAHSVAGIAVSCQPSIGLSGSDLNRIKQNVTIEDCYNSGLIEWNEKDVGYIGGILGYASVGGISTMSLSRCYNIGEMDGELNDYENYKVGTIAGNIGIVNGSQGSLAMKDNYYLYNGYPGYNTFDQIDRYEATACTTVDMKDASTYRNWDFNNVWQLGSGDYYYPVLRGVEIKIYKVIIEGNGGKFGIDTWLRRITNINGRLASLPKPKWEGKRFAGYYTEETGGELITKETVFENNTTIYAHWKDYNEADRVLITPISPEQGEKGVAFEKGNKVNLLISFQTSVPVKEIDTSSCGVKIVKKNNNETIYECDNADDFIIRNQNDGSIIEFRYVYKPLECNTEYYIDIEDGFLVFDNPDLFAYTDKQWWFATKDAINKKIRIRNEYVEDDEYIDYTFEYSDNFFVHPATEYNHERTIWAFGLAMAGFTSYMGEEIILDAAKEERYGYKNAEEMLKNFGFSKGEANDDYKHWPSQYSFGTYCASKEITVDEGGTPKDYTLIAVATRGAGYSHEWYSNGIVGLSDQHEGFWLASNRMLNHIAQYIKDKNITGDVKIIMAGYSRAAATTNLTAARIDEGELAQKLSSAGISANIESKNVYAYCFEPPAVTRVRKLPSNDYNNIFCFINPADLVPMVPLSGAGWDYRRYGKTYYLPSPTTNSKNYVTLKESFLYRHKEFFGVEYDNNRFYQYRNLSGIVWIKGENSIASYLPGFFTRVKHAIPTYSYYYHHDQDTVADLLEYHFTKKSDFNAGEVLKSIITAIPALAFHIKSDIPTMLLNSYDYKNGLIFQMHEPSVNFTWLTTINGEEDYNTGEWNVIYLNCPINASVYNSSNELVARINNDDPVRINGSYIGSYLDENNQKVFILPKDDDFRIEIEATDNGTMDYAVAEYSLDEESYTKKTLYQDVAINKGNNLSGNVEADGDISFSKEGTGIAATQTFTGSVPEYEVSADIEGYGKVEGQGYIQIGNYVKLVAVPDPGAEFDGWYDNNGNLVSKDKEYRFRVDEAVSYRAKFSEIDGIMITPIERQEYSGQAVRPDVELHDGVTELVQGIDYTVTYKNNKNAFTFDDEDKLTDAQKKKAPQAIIKMKGNYSGKKIAYFCIDPLSIKDEGVFDAEFKKGNKAVVFKYNGKALKEKTDYTVDRINGSSVTISGKGNFTDTYDFTVADPKASVKKISMSKVVVESIPAQFYTGEVLTKDSFKAKDGKSSYTIRVSYPKGTVLKEGTDYRIAKILNPTKIGTATVVLKGLRAGGTDGASSKYSFIGEKRIKVKIKPGNIGTAVVTGADGKETLSAVYNKTGAVPDDLTVTVNGRVLKAGRDYTVKYSANTKYTGTGEKSSKAGKLTIKGRGNFRGSKKLTFKITRRPFAKDSGITVVASDKPQSGKAGDFATEVKVFDREGGLLKAGTDYEKEIKYTAADGKVMDNAALVNEGDVITVTVKGKGGYTDGTVSTSYKIIKQGESNDISKASIRIDSLAYTKGRATLSGNNASHVKATMSGGRTLNFSTDGVSGDFMVLPGSYVNNDRKGTARVTFIGINGFSGAKTVKFKIGTRSLAEWWKGLFK